MQGRVRGLKCAAGTVVRRAGKTCTCRGFAATQHDSASTWPDPRELKGRVVTLGNAAGAGACACLISQTAREMLSDLEFSYIELSVAPLFTGAFMEEMIFETGEN